MPPHASSADPTGPTIITLDFAGRSVAVSPHLYGLMTEEINYSYDGGLYGELVRNRNFLDDAEIAKHWRTIGDGATMELDHADGPSAALRTSLKFRGAVANDGYWGMPIRPSTSYRLSLWAKTDFRGALSCSLESSDGTAIYARCDIAGVNGEWRKFEAVLTTGTDIDPSNDGRLVIRWNGEQEVWLGLVSLFPPTFGDRPNGNRGDLMPLLIEMKPRFLRFPGGNYLEGDTFKDRFDWKKTLGPLEHRSGHMAPWGYRSTDGMGLLEFLLWCEDMKAEPVLGVFAGYVLRGDYIEAGTELSGFVQDALDEIEYIVGGPETKWGARRIEDGHPEPFPLTYVEVGNEDGFDRSGSYEGRFVQFYDAIKAKYPAIRVISSTGGKDPLGSRFPITARTPDVVDEHYYASTWDMMAMASKYDDYDRQGPKIFVGEWAAQDVPEPWNDAATKGPTPNMNCALADAAFMTGLERNSDLVVMACYAPLLVNVNPGGRQWAVNLIGYDSLNSFGSPSYYAQKMFMENIGDVTVSVSISGAPVQTRDDQALPGLFASATMDSVSRRVFLKIVNPLDLPQEINFEIESAEVAEEGKMVVLSGTPESVNSLAEPFRVSPVTSSLTGLGSSFRQTLAPHSVTVITLFAR